MLADTSKIKDANAFHISRLSAKLGDIPPLTGLRFFAAFFVVLGHAAETFAHFSPPPALTLSILGGLLSVGMSLFFVLSGFVIHYNYADLVRSGSTRSLAKFLVARFARLYPLYLLFLIAVVITGWTPEDFPVLPYYLTFSQSWTYILYDHKSLISHMRYAAVTWSISSEWFFYLCYPAIAWLLFRFRAKGPAILALVFIAGQALSYFDPQVIHRLANAVWGSAATDPSDGNNMFYAWFLNYSPFGRLHEFIMGVLAAQLFITWSNRAPTPKETRYGYIILSLALAALILIHYALHVFNGTRYYRYLAAASPLVIAFSVACIVFACSRYKTMVSWFLSTRPLILAGEASYSIYLFHIFALQSIAVPNALPINNMFIAYILSRFAVVAVFLILISMGMYQVVEVPCRKLIRKKLENVEERQVLLIIALCIGLPCLIAIHGWAVSLHLL
jgi:peptidoglycan/LPS O-acetylase OafA/YrhL